MAYVPGVYKNNGVGCLSQNGNESVTMSEEGIFLNAGIINPPLITVQLGLNGLSTTNPNGLNVISKLNMNNQDITNVGNITATNFNGPLTLTTATGNTEFNILVSTASTGIKPVKGSGSDLTYNPQTQTLSVKNMTVSGNENQTGTITTNILKTDIMIQQVSYIATQIINIPDITALKVLGTFIMTTYDSGNIGVNSIITVNLPALPTDGSLDGYTFQLRKLRGGVNQTSPNWSINTVASILIPNGNTLNLGSGGTNTTSNVSSFTQRYTIITFNNVGYYIGCQS